MSENEPLPSLPPRLPEGHKGDYGHALVIGGSRGLTGAVVLSGWATLRSGAGLVTLAVPSACQETVASIEPSYMTAALACDAEGRIAAGAAEEIPSLLLRATVCAVGPGLGRSAELDALVGRLYDEVRLPMVVDADALGALAQQREKLQTAGTPRDAGPRILTPHPGEFARLTGRPKPAAEHRAAAANQLAHDTGAVVVLKGHRTIVADGSRTYINTTGNPGMATGGSGDVLTGVILGLLALGLGPFDAARLGAAVHGAAGDLAAAELGQTSMIASDLVRFLPPAFLRVQTSPAG
jgi:NAD(P)H-hydrate epimerase